MRWYDLHFHEGSRWHLGDSICENDKLQLALDIIDKAKAKGVNLVLAEDCICADSFSNDANTQVCSAKEIPAGWEGLDIGPKSRVKFADAIKDAKTILGTVLLACLNSTTSL